MIDGNTTSQNQVANKFEPKPFLEAVNVSKTYLIPQGLFQSPQQLCAVNKVNLKIYKGETLGIVGESGCGKSTLARILAGTLLPTVGELLLEGANLGTLPSGARKKLLRQIQMIFQSPYSSLDPRMTILSIVREPLDIHEKELSLSLRNEKALDMLQRVGLHNAFADRNPHHLSGGQLQRVGIARALIANAKLVICDEPVSALDVSIQAQVINLLHDMQQSMNLSYVFVSHDLAVVSNISDRIVVMYLGKVVEYGLASEVLNRPAHPYTQALIDSVSIPDPSVEKTRRIRILSGEIPKPTAPPSGCQFRTRCWKAKNECEFAEPALTVKSGFSQVVACHFA